MMPEGYPDTLQRKDLMVYRCTECQDVWGGWNTGYCPDCSEPVEETGLTVEEYEAADEALHVYCPRPLPFEMVMLFTLPEGMWVGMPVFHPSEQNFGGPIWFRYDVGVVCEVFVDETLITAKWPAKKCVRCRFIGSDGSTLSYHAENLWVPRRLADRLTGVLEQIADAAMVAAHREQK